MNSTKLSLLFCEGVNENTYSQETIFSDACHWIFKKYLLSFLSYTLSFLCSFLHCIFANSFVGTIWSIFKEIFSEESRLN